MLGNDANIEFYQVSERYLCSFIPRKLKNNLKFPTPDSLNNENIGFYGGYLFIYNRAFLNAANNILGSYISSIKMISIYIYIYIYILELKDKYERTL
jgi:hypothetical protein